MNDYGFFGPGSPTWKVWGYPTSATIGFQRSVVIEELDPFLIAAVDATNKVRYEPRRRYDRTLRYFATVAFGDTLSALKAAEILVKVHANAVGIEPISGLPYDANAPESQLWIHLTAWHSILYAYEAFGPGPLSAADEARYWEECAIAAELQTCPREDVPLTRDGIRAYFASMRPRLAASETAQAMMDHLLNAEVMFPPLPRAARPGALVVNQVLRMGTIATMPHWMRRMSGFRQPKAVDTAIRPVLTANFRAANATTAGKLAMIKLISPSTLEVVEPALRGVAPAHKHTLTPAEARERHGFLTPTEQYAQLRERRPLKVAA
ncbi:MAG: hypothetical protein QOF76_302 [Solirubrobacteraceae bacterium]|nr:hypothetical protein [Solirubrobacteraceae bacterium]